MRRVRTLRLSATDQQLIRRGHLLLEDGLRTASLPDTEGGRLYVVRSLDIGAIRAGGPPSRVALAVERSFSALRSTAVHALSSTAPVARAVYFADGVEAHVQLASRLARQLPVDDWFWPLAVPALRDRLQPRDVALRSVLFSALELGPGPVAAVLLVQDTVRHDVADALLESLRWQDGPALLRATNLSPATPSRFGVQSGRRSGVVPRLAESQRALLARWSAHWSQTDARTTWLAAVVLALDKPARILEQAHPARIDIEALLATDLVEEHNAAAQRPEIARSEQLRVASQTTDDNLPVEVEVEVEVTREADSPHSATPFTPLEARPSALFKALSQTPDEPPSPPRDPVSKQYPDARSPAPFEQSPSSSSSPSLDAPMPTHYAGLYFVLRLLQRLQIAAAPDAIEFDLAARILLRLAARLRIPHDDPILQPLPALDPDAQADVVADQWLSRARRLCRQLCRMGLSHLVRRQGSISFTRTHIDLTFHLASVDIRVRRVGLDLDPGWLPWFGRVVLFHYRDPSDAT